MTIGQKIRVTLSRDEVLACVIVFEARKKPGEWEKSALRKLLKAINLGWCIDKGAKGW